MYILLTKQNMFYFSRRIEKLAIQSFDFFIKWTYFEIICVAFSILITGY